MNRIQFHLNTKVTLIAKRLYNDLSLYYAVYLFNPDVILILDLYLPANTIITMPSSKKLITKKLLNS